MVNLNGDIPEWSSNGIFVLNSIKEQKSSPSDFTLLSAYPNQFNPETRIDYEIPLKSMVSTSFSNFNSRLNFTLKG